MFSQLKKLGWRRDFQLCLVVFLLLLLIRLLVSWSDWGKARAVAHFTRAINLSPPIAQLVDVNFVTDPSSRDAKQNTALCHSAAARARLSHDLAHTGRPFVFR